MKFKTGNDFIYAPIIYIVLRIIFVKNISLSAKKVLFKLWVIVETESIDNETSQLICQPPATRESRNACHGVSTLRT